jgi:glycosyltransferase involved in cell wall biosynthesis
MSKTRPEHWHLITPEYPPQIGGVGDYTRAVGKELASQGEKVHVWFPETAAKAPEDAGLELHALRGGYTAAGLEELTRQLDATAKPRRLFVQWVPHGYDRRALNWRFPRWLRRRAKAGDQIDLMIHEPFLMFREGSWKQDVVAVAHRWFMHEALQAAARIWLSIPAWEPLIRPWLRGQQKPVAWLPIPSGIVVDPEPPALRLFGGEAPVLGHFGTYSRETRQYLTEIFRPLFAAEAPVNLLLLGRGSDDFAEELRERFAARAGAILGLGAQDAMPLSAALHACGVMLQPYTDGISSRRSSAMAGLIHGKPIVTTAGKATEALWRESEAVVLVPAEDRAGIAAACLRLLADPVAADALGQRGLAAYKEHFAVSGVVAKLRATI